MTSNTLEADGNISGGFGLTKAGNGTLLLLGSNSFSGGTTVTAGTLQLGTGSNSQDGSLSSGTIANSAALVYNLYGNQTYSGAIGGNGSLTKLGVGTLTLGGSNGYSGRTYLNNGTVSLANVNALAGGTSISFGGGTLQYTASNTQDYSNQIANSTAAVKIDTNGQNASFAGTLAASNSGGFTKIVPETCCWRTRKITPAPEHHRRNIDLDAALAHAEPPTPVERHSGRADQRQRHGHAMDRLEQQQPQRLLHRSSHYRLGEPHAPTYSNGSVVFTSTANVLMANVPAGTLSGGFTLFVVASRTSSASAGSGGFVSMTGTGQYDRTGGNYASPFDLYGTTFYLSNGAVPAAPTPALSTSPTPTRSRCLPSRVAATPLRKTSTGSHTFHRRRANYGANANYIYLGSRADGNSTFVGNMEEVLLYSGTMSAAQQQQIWANLNSEWSISGGTGPLPAATPVSISNSAMLDLDTATQTIASLSSSDPTTRVILGGGA